MDRKKFDEYLGYFNAKDYEKVLEYFTEDFVIKFAGYEVKKREGFLAFYGFFHSMVKEQIEIHQFAGDEENVIIDVNVRVEGIRQLTQSILDEEGYDRLVPLEIGEVKVLPQFIHYEIVNGKFREIRCVVKDPD